MTESTLTPLEFAARLNGREYRSEITKDECAEAKSAGLVVVFGASDDLIEFGGALHGEGGCFDGGTFLLDWADFPAAWLEKALPAPVKMKQLEKA